MSAAEHMLCWSSSRPWSAYMARFVFTHALKDRASCLASRVQPCGVRLTPQLRARAASFSTYMEQRHLQWVPAHLPDVPSWHSDDLKQ